MKRLSIVFALIGVWFASNVLLGQHPAEYDEVKGRTHVADFDLESDSRSIVRDYPASFFTENPVSQKFRVLIKPDGTVKYVKPIPEPGVPAEFRLGGAHALYRFEFAPAVRDLSDDEWVDIVMHVGDAE
ncbi:MAG: hypothetical protein AAGN35_09830 [Bacteroidota bacterium]